MGLYYQNYDDGTWEYTNNDNYIKAYQCIQEILIWRGECNFNVNLGINYKEIFDSNSFLTAQLEEILEKYRPFFSGIFQSIERVMDSFVITLEFAFSNVSTNPTPFDKKEQIKSSLRASFKYKTGGFDVSVR